jgi:aconitate hydratase A / 2-methylisocitrate dehydratase
MSREPASNSAGSTEAVAEAVYERLQDRVEHGRRQLGRPLTCAEKLLVAHLRNADPGRLVRGSSDADLYPDRVVLQDALAQIVVLQFIVAGLDETAVPTTVHCDHLIRARDDAASDLGRALDDNAEVYEFLRAACARYGIGFWEPGSGIIHQVVLENYAFPGGLMIGTDSHTPNAGGLGMVAVGVGGGDAIDVMTGSPFNVRWPRLIGVRLAGALPEWCTPKDVILELARILTVAGGTGAIIEYFGSGARSISATGKATICNMGAELGATTSLFPYDTNIGAYLRATGRATVAGAADRLAPDLRADSAVDADPEAFFDRVVDIDLSTLQPRVNGPDAPDLSHRVGEVGPWARAHDVPPAISVALVGSCTNSSYEDIARAASIAREAAAGGLRARVPLLVTPGSERVRATIERDGLLADLEAIGATVLANACGPCIGQWERRDAAAGTANSIVTSFNRNFPRRNDGNADTKAFVTSPEMVVAYSLAGTLDFDPRTDPVVARDGRLVRLSPPSGDELPARGFVERARLSVAPAPDASAAEVSVSPESERLQLLEPFPEWDGQDLTHMPVLVKAKGRCTTDHISPAGPWLRYRGHLENISGNLFLGAVNAFTGRTGEGKDPLDGGTRPFPEIARRCAAASADWCVVADHNYGEGSSREHAALEPRYRGARAVLARSFARIHETNLKKQGLLALTFADPATYDLVEEDDRISVLGLAALAPGEPVHCRITKPTGTTVDFDCTHTFSEQQVEWFRSGSALNVIRTARD